MFLIFFSIANISLQPEYFTNTNYIYDLTGQDTMLYCATNGGAVAYNYLSGTFRVLTNTDGLQINRQNSISIDSSGFIWVGNDFGLALIDQDFSSVQVYPISTSVNQILCINDTIYVCTSDGLLIIYTNGTPENFSDDTRVTIYQANGLPSNNVRCVAVDTTVWVGTDEGLVRFRDNFTYSTQYTTTNGLLSSYINKIAIIDTSVYVGTDQGLNRFQGTYFDTLVLNYEVKDISNIGDSLVLALNAPAQIGFYHQGNFTISHDGLPSQCPVLTLKNVEGNLFCGLANRYGKDYYGEGIGRCDFSSNYWNIIKRVCLPSNHITDIAANDSGVFVTCGARSSVSRGLGWLKNDGAWLNFNSDSVLTSNHIHRCVTAPDKKVWFGINTVSNTGKDTVLCFSYDPLTAQWNFIEVGYQGMENTVAVWDIQFDYHNNMYLSVAGFSDRLWVIDSTLHNVYALNPFQPGFFTEIAIDSMGRIWRTMVAAGLIMTDTKNTLFNRNDDTYHNYTTSDGLLSNYTVGCIVDKTGNLYVATLDGLVMYDGATFTNITGISNEDLFDVEVDNSGRIWILARDGIYCYDPEYMVIEGWKFTDFNVNIEFLDVSTEIIQVQGFEFDPLRSCFWLGGETGLLKFKIQSDTLPGLDKILIYPNPVVDHNIVRIKNLPTNARVSFYSIAGRLLAKDLMPDIFGEVVWHIPDDIRSGLYFALVKSPQGNKVCKFAIVR